MRIPKPTGQRVLVEPASVEAAVGRVLLPEIARETRPAEAVVVAVGPRCTLPVKVGDRVLTARYNGSEVHVGGARYRLLEPDDLLALVD